MRKTKVCLLRLMICVVGLGMLVVPLAHAVQEGRQRVAAPAWLSCPRDKLTSYMGKVLSLRTTRGQTVIRIRTDWETTESVTIRHPKSSSPEAWFRLKGEPFQAADWALIEVKRGQIKPDLRANVWVCEDSHDPVVDWQVQK